MKRLSMISGAALGLLLALALGGGWLMGPAASQEQGGPGQQVEGPVEIRRLVLAQRFDLASSYTHVWRSERPEISSGWLLVLDVDPLAATPRAEPEPVLYVGRQTAERVNTGHVSGRLIAIVPGGVDLTEAPLWFGLPAIPERIDAADVEQQLDLARNQGIGPRPAAELTAALGLGGAPAVLADRTALERHAARLVLAWSPGDQEFAHGLLAPLVH